MLCDDGSIDEGEWVYIRSDRVVIGRNQGDIVIGHDAAMSGNHAEITRKDIGGKFGWVLRDLGSANGTFARVRNLTLKPGISIILGSKRYRFEVPQQSNSRASGKPDTGTIFVRDLAGTPSDSLPALTESQTPSGGGTARHPIRSTKVTIGRPGYGNSIEINDSCLSKTHAVITRDGSGEWQLESQSSLNGVWAKVDAIRLVDNCQFQCGEQRFRFRL
jgi:hypothetical protein